MIEIARKLFLCYPEKNIQLHEKQFKNNKEKVKYFPPRLKAEYKKSTKIEKMFVENLICYES